MTVLIFTGGRIFADSINELNLGPSSGQLIIAADSGYNNARRLGVVPDLLLGDLDSIDRSDLKPHEFDHLEKIIVPAIKDDTDTQLAVDTAIERGADNIIIIGGLGGRIDHTLSNVFLLEYIAKKNVRALITDGRNRVRLMRADGALTSMSVEPGFKYLSLVSLTDTCENVSISGVFYPLSGKTLERSYSYAVSNEITADHAEISLEKGSLLVIESRD